MSWHSVARVRSMGDAEGVRSALEAAGIEARVFGGHVEVREEDVARADELLAVDAVIVDDVDDHAVDDIVHEAIPVLDAPRAELPACPNCGGHEVARISRLRMLALFAMVGLGAGVAVGHGDMAFGFVFIAALVLLLGPTHRCLACGEKWRPPEDELAQQHHAPPPDGADLDP